MAKSITKPWILDSFIDILNEKKQKEKINYPAKVVQVIKTNYEHGYLILSDTKHYIAAFLTSSERRRLENEGRNSQETLNELQNSLIRLEKDAYIFSTVIQCAGDRAMSNMIAAGITLPVALQCNRITYFSASDTGIMGEPADINIDLKFQGVTEKLTYIKLLNTLTLRQYPKERSLPDCDGKFLLPPKYDDANPEIYINHCLISDDQKIVLDRIDSFDHSKIVEIRGNQTINKESVVNNGDNNNNNNNDKLKTIETSKLSDNIKKSQTQIYTQDLSLTQTDDADIINYFSQTQTDETNYYEDESLKATFFTQPAGAELTQDFIHGLSDMLTLQQSSQSIDKLVGRAVYKYFPNFGWFHGIVVNKCLNKEKYKILYEDNDEEEISEAEVMKILVDENKKVDKENKNDDENKNKSQKNKNNEEQKNIYAQQVNKTSVKEIEKESTINAISQSKSKPYKRPDIFELLEYIYTAKYLPCGYDKDGKVVKVLRVE